MKTLKIDRTKMFGNTSIIVAYTGIGKSSLATSTIRSRYAVMLTEKYIADKTDQIDRDRYLAHINKEFSKELQCHT